MAATGPDTSFLFALYGHDAHTATAQAAVRSRAEPLLITPLLAYELNNALRFASFRRVISAAEAKASAIAFEADLASGHLAWSGVSMDEIVREASRLSVLHTATGGHRSFDILHVAAARALGVRTHFFTFDPNQRTLALAAGLTAGP